MAKIKFFALVLVIICFPMFSQESPDESGLDYVEEQADGSSMNWTNKVLRVTGNGFGPERIKALGRRKILAKRAARLDAQRNILEAVKGVQVTSSTSVKDMMLESDQIQTGAQGLVKGMRVVNVTYTDDGGCEMIAEISLGEKGNFLLSALNDSIVDVKDNYPKFDWIAMKDEFEKTKATLASTQKTLDSTQKNLASTRYVLNRKNKELKEIKAEYAILKDDFGRNREALIAANQNLTRAEQGLKSSNLKKDELTATLDITQKELNKTKSIVDNLTRALNSQKIDNAVNNKELAMTKNFLSEKKTQLARLDSELNKYREDYQDAANNTAKLKGYIQRLKDTQDQTGQKLDSFYSRPPKDVEMNYTGLLIDARSLGLKPVLAPAILNEQEEKIYGVGVIPKTLKGGAIVDYLSGSIDKVKQYKKVGPDPLLIKGIKSVNQSDIMISNADTKKLVSIVNLLEEQKVAVLL
jgi:archaellum component FlaC